MKTFSFVKCSECQNVRKVWNSFFPPEKDHKMSVYDFKICEITNHSIFWNISKDRSHGFKILWVVLYFPKKPCMAQKLSKISCVWQSLMNKSLFSLLLQLGFLGLRWATEIFHTLKSLLKKAGHVTSVGDEGVQSKHTIQLHGLPLVFFPAEEFMRKKCDRKIPQCIKMKHFFVVSSHPNLCFVQVDFFWCWKIEHVFEDQEILKFSNFFLASGKKSTQLWSDQKFCDVFFLRTIIEL